MQFSNGQTQEDSFSIQVRDDSGVSHSFWKTDLDKVDPQEGKSPMPSFKDRLSEAEVTDLVAYLATLKEMK